MRYVVINEHGEVVNAIEMEEGVEWTTPEGCIVMQHETASIGWNYKDGIFVAPVVTLPSKTKNEMLLEDIATLEATMTPRRIREAVKDPTWMDALDKQIADLRSQLV